MSLFVSKFLKRGTNKGKNVVRGTRVNRGAGYGLEIPCQYIFHGGTKMSLPWLKSKLECLGYNVLHNVVIPVTSAYACTWCFKMDKDKTNIEIWYCNYCKIIVTKGNVKWLIDKTRYYTEVVDFLLGVRLRELKNKEKVSVVIPACVRVHLRECPLTRM